MERPTHPPDQIIKGKPKWTEIGIKRVSKGIEEETEFNVDRLNPSRHLIEEIETSCSGPDNAEAEDTQRVIVNMMCDLKCELLVTLGDSRLDPDTEKKYMEKHEEWECYKVSNIVKTHSCLNFLISIQFFILDQAWHHRLEAGAS